MLSTNIVDGTGDNHPLKVNAGGEIEVIVHNHPPLNEGIASLPFRQYFTDDGTSSGSNDWAVNGSVNSVDFFIKAVPTHEIYIKSISIVIGDGGSPALNKYGALSALTNGVEWSLFDQANGNYILHDGIKTNIEFIRIGVDTAAIGTGTDAFLADVSGGGTEKSYLPTIDISETFGMPYGIRLRKGSTDKIIFKVRDDLTGLLTHNAIAYGIRL